MREWVHCLTGIIEVQNVISEQRSIENIIHVSYKEKMT